MYDVVAIGELLIDFASQGADAEGYPLMAAHAGGAPCNFLAALSRYGARTAFIGKVGDDTFGHLLVNTLKKAGVDTRGVLLDKAYFTTLAFVTFDEYGDRSFSFARKPGADTMLRCEELELSIIDESRVLHFGTVNMSDEPARTANRRAVEYAREKKKLITFDPNYRPPLWRDQNDAKEQILWGIAHADVVKISDEELEFLWGCGVEEGAERLIRDYGVSLAMVTLGPKGCILKNKNSAVRVGTIAVKTVDTTGAGDIFGGSAVARLLELNKAPDALEEKELLDIARFAGTAATLSTQYPGGISSIRPREEVLERMGGLA